MKGERETKELGIKKGHVDIGKEGRKQGRKEGRKEEARIAKEGSRQAKQIWWERSS